MTISGPLGAFPFFEQCGCRKKKRRVWFCFEPRSDFVCASLLQQVAAGQSPCMKIFRWQFVAHLAFDSRKIIAIFNFSVTKFHGKMQSSTQSCSMRAHIHLTFCLPFNIVSKNDAYYRCWGTEIHWSTFHGSWLGQQILLLSSTWFTIWKVHNTCALHVCTGATGIALTRHFVCFAGPQAVEPPAFLGPY